MPKTKPKVPKTEKMWMGWDGKRGYVTFAARQKKHECQSDLDIAWYADEATPICVRIVPEAEYKRLIAASKRKDKETK